MVYMIYMIYLVYMVYLVYADFWFLGCIVPLCYSRVNIWNLRLQMNWGNVYERCCSNPFETVNYIIKQKMI